MPLWDEMEQCFASPEIQQRVRDMQEESAFELSNQSKERAPVDEEDCGTAAWRAFPGVV